ncbi:S-layer homology domain-containing protein [Paenibacillus spiritus]|uniref:S-layer homology domain-containing protein n=1 Tax=Paenibacillus spiritus TaxID=2496557 RepID=A0A5J5G925_9BACL|nr:S-layer homology domain-containing protein [Paenibacillus spiritus]KAA9004101.1 S-layer homology domain-containing protein [Paenibacillus spiritus]
MKKKAGSITFASLALTALLSLSVAGSLYAAAAPFGDLGTTEGSDKIQSLHSKGIIQGMNAQSFAPKAPLTAAQGIQLIAGGFQFSLDAIRFIQEPKAAQVFTKVLDGQWYTEAFLGVYHNGVPVPEDIDPASRLTRELFTFLLVRGMEQAGSLPLINVKPSGIADESSLAPEYQGAVVRSLKYGITRLDSSGRFDPKREISRGEAAVMLYDALDYLRQHPAPAAADNS